MPFSATKGYLTKPKPGVMLNPLHPLSRGLVGYWLLNEGAGSRANDISMHGNHGTLKNMSPNAQNSGWGGAKFGSGLHFDGIDDYIDCGNDPSLKTNHVSINMWVLPNDLTDWSMLYGCIYGTGIWLALDSVEKVAVYTKTRYWGGVTSSLPLGSWSNICVTHDGDVISVYLDGKFVDSIADNNDLDWTGATGIQIGRQTNNSYPYDGSIDSGCIYDRAISAEEVKQLYHDPFCNLLRVPVRYVPAAAGGLPIPVAMNHYRRRRVT